MSLFLRSSCIRNSFTSRSIQSSILSNSFRTTTSPFSTSAAKMSKPEWIFIIKDKANSLDARMKVRPQHLEELKPHIESGAIALGGATLDEPLKEGVGMKSNGSVLIIAADSEQEARKIVESDVYYTSGVWEQETIQMFPFSCAVRKAK